MLIYVSYITAAETARNNIQSYDRTKGKKKVTAAANCVRITDRSWVFTLVSISSITQMKH